MIYGHYFSITFPVSGVQHALLAHMHCLAFNVNRYMSQCHYLFYKTLRVYYLYLNIIFILCSDGHMGG